MAYFQPDVFIKKVLNKSKRVYSSGVCLGLHSRRSECFFFQIQKNWKNLLENLPAARMMRGHLLCCSDHSDPKSCIGLESNCENEFGALSGKMVQIPNSDAVVLALQLFKKKAKLCESLLPKTRNSIISQIYIRTRSRRKISVWDGKLVWRIVV